MIAQSLMLQLTGAFVRKFLDFVRLHERTEQSVSSGILGCLEAL